MTVGERIKAIREKNSITQIELATACNISKQNLYKYENNIITNIPSDKIEKIAKCLSVTPSYLMGWDDKAVMNTIQNDTDIQKTKLIHNYEALNTIGQSKLVEYSEDLKTIHKYTEKTYKVKIAARNGHFEEKTLTDSEIQKIMELPDVTEDDLKY